MSRKTSFKEQMFRVLNSKNCFGQSKHKAKQTSYQTGGKGKLNGIYSKKTMADYKKVAEQFHAWQKSKGYHFHSLNDVKQSVLIEYLQDRQNKGCSAWTVSRDQSALNKIFGMSISKATANLASRHVNNIKNNRGLGNNYRPSVYLKNKDIIDFICATGVRRQSLTVITPSNAIRNANNVVIGFSVIEKGGKPRNCYVRNEYQQQITAFVNHQLETKGNQPFWSKIDKNLNTHWYRSEYAVGLYNGLASAKASNQDYFNGYQATFINKSKLQSATKGHKATTKGYDTELLGMVSQNLGHNRIDVVYTNYLGKF